MQNTSPLPSSDQIVSVLVRYSHVLSLYSLVFEALRTAPTGMIALQDFNNMPYDADNQAVLRKEIRKKLTDEPQFSYSLVTLMERIVSNPSGILQDVPEERKVLSSTLQNARLSASRDMFNVSGNARVAVKNEGDSLEGNQVLKVGTVATTQGDLELLREKLDTLQHVVSGLAIEEDEKEAALSSVLVLRQELDQKEPDKKPNGTLMVQAAEALFKYGPAVSGALVSAFSTPLAGALVYASSRKALDFYKELHQNNQNPSE